jgi:RimJ/RimL family protein N-acetyltransferase
MIDRSWGRGYGTLLMQAGVEHVRQEGFLRLDADTIAKNKAMLRIAEKVGFKIEGKRRMMIKLNGKYEDEVLLGLVLSSDDWTK